MNITDYVHSLLYSTLQLELLDDDNVDKNDDDDDGNDVDDGNDDVNDDDDDDDDYIQGCSVEGSSRKVWQPVGEGGS